MVQTAIPVPDAKRERAYPFAVAVTIAVGWFIVGFFFWWAWQFKQLAEGRDNPAMYQTRADWEEERNLCALAGLVFLAFGLFVLGAVYTPDIELTRNLLWVGAVVLAGFHIELFITFLFRRD